MSLKYNKMMNALKILIWQGRRGIFRSDLLKDFRTLSYNITLKFEGKQYSTVTSYTLGKRNGLYQFPENYHVLKQMVN